MPGWGHRLREERLRLGMSQDQLGTIARQSRKSVLRYESEERAPDAHFLEAIAAHGADVLYILTGRREQPAIEHIKTLTAAIEIIEEALAKRRATLPPAKKAEVIALAYDILKGDAQGQEKVERMLRLVA
jgi:transcriptional regulator with XRE-family HTH domain